MVSVLADPGLYVHTGGGPPSLGELRARYERQVSRDGWLNWMLRLRSDGCLIGFVQASVNGTEADLAWVLSADQQGFGLATEAMTAVVEWLASIDVVSLSAYIRPDHVASQAVAKRLGLEATDTMREGEARWLTPR